MSQLMSIAVFMLILVSCSDNPTKPDTPSSVLEKQLKKLTQETGFPGAMGVISSDSAILELRVDGIRKVGEVAKIANQDLIHIGSITKSMDAVMIARVIESGQLRWDSKVIDVIPGLAEIAHDGYADVTLLDLLHHRGGVPSDDEINLEDVPELSGTLTEQRIQSALWAFSLPPAHQRGEYSYSNLGYTIAACMAEVATGRSWQQLMTERLFQPLGITAVYGWPTAYSPNQPWGHDWSGSAFTPQPPSVYPDWIKFLEPAGDLSMSMVDLNKFVTLLLSAARGDARLLTAASYQVLFTPVGDYACGLEVVQAGESVIYLHNGSNEYFYLLMYILPDDNLAGAIGTNGYDVDKIGAVHYALEAVLEGYLSRAN